MNIINKLRKNIRLSLGRLGSLEKQLNVASAPQRGASSHLRRGVGLGVGPIIDAAHLACSRLFPIFFILHSSLFTFHFSLFIFHSSPARADVWDIVCSDSLRIDTTRTGQLHAQVNSLAFFHNNEYSSDLAKGYTLPGAWLQPKLIYTPHPQIQFEAGAHLLLFNGANRYPNYAFHDVARWKGHQYQRGIHVLPWFRAQADFRNLTLVLGNIYGAQNHQLILPLYNPEQNLSTDPEMGFQLLWQRPRLHFDVWINWQSYIFNLDTHQEAFTVGLNSTIRWNRPDTQKRLRWETPIQVLIQHRGGELDTTNVGVQTVANIALGARATYRPSTPYSKLSTLNTKPSTLNSISAEANLLLSYQQHGTLWPFDTGFALHTALSATLWERLTAQVGYVAIPRRYANLYGQPYFGTLSIRYHDLTFRGMHTAYATVDYSHCFTPAYRLGAQFTLYSANSHDLHTLPISFGIYLRLCPDFRIWKKKG